MEKDYQHRIITQYFYPANIKAEDIVIEKSKIDVTINGLMGQSHILIEFKEVLEKQEDIDKALTQIVLTCKKHNIYGKYYGVMGKYNGENTFIFFEHKDLYFNSLAFNVNNERFDLQEKPSSPTREAIINITASLKGNLKEISGYEIRDVLEQLMANNTNLPITENNITTIFKKWLDTVIFDIQINDEDLLINLFLTDILDGTIYKRKTKESLLDEECNTKFDKLKNENRNEIIFIETYNDGKNKKVYTIKNIENYNKFWNVYKRPPNKENFIEMYEKRHQFFTETYRKKVGGQYTPKILINLQNEILKENAINVEDYIVFDPCCGTANLQEDFVNKDNCYLSTLDYGDVLVAQSKSFKNVVQFDFLKNNKFPTWEYKGKQLSINEIAEMEKKEILVIMNPPYENERFITITEKIVKYIKKCKYYLYSNATLFEKEIYFDRLAKLNPYILSNSICNASDTFGLSNWGVSMTLFDFNPLNRKKINSKIEFIRYDVANKFKVSEKMIESGKVYFDCKKQNYKNYIEDKIKLEKDDSKIILGQYNILTNGLFITNEIKAKYDMFITASNIEDIFVSGGILYNTHPDYWEYNVIKSPSKKLSNEFKANCLISSLFYKTNKTKQTKQNKNYFVPFTEKELGIPLNVLNVYMEKKDIFDFREWLAPYKKEMSQEATEVYNSVLNIYKFYFEYFKKNSNYNVGFAELKDSFIQGKIDINEVKLSENKKGKGILGFGARIGENSTWRPSILDRKYNTNIFSTYDNALLSLFAKIQDGMIEHGILEQRMAKLR